MRRCSAPALRGSRLVRHGGREAIEMLSAVKHGSAVAAAGPSARLVESQISGEGCASGVKCRAGVRGGR